MTDIEIWKDIKDYEGLYQVSNLGRVKSLNYRHTGKEEVMKPGEDKKGYFQVVLCKNGKVKMFRVHRLVTTAFLPNLEGKPEVNHIDEDKTNNRVENLEWCDRKYNNNHGTRNERVAKAQSKTVLQFTKLGSFIREWPSTMECGRNGFNQGNVAACCRGELKSHKGYIWMYK